MKNKISVCLLFIATLCVSCDSFLEREPLDKISSDVYFKTSKDLELYVNQFYESFQDLGDTVLVILVRIRIVII